MNIRSHESSWWSAVNGVTPLVRNCRECPMTVILFFKVGGYVLVVAMYAVLLFLVGNVVTAISYSDDIIWS